MKYSHFFFVYSPFKGYVNAEIVKDTAAQVAESSAEYSAKCTAAVIANVPRNALGKRERTESIEIQEPA